MVRAILVFLATMSLVAMKPRMLAWGQGDAQCLLQFKASVSDPDDRLASWSSSNAARICFWDGVSCFEYFDLTVYKLILANFGLSGPWPAGLSQCQSLQTLDISYNALTGPIPASICEEIPNLVTLNAQHNELQGRIPGELGSCKYLNEIYLNNNKLQGEIPSDIALAPRLMRFSVANNDLSGVIPSTFTGDTVRFNASSFEGNAYLCGSPLSVECKSKPGGEKGNLGAIVGGIVGGVLVILGLFGAVFWWFVRSREEVLERRKVVVAVTKKDRRWARRSTVLVAMFDDSVGRVMMADLVAATDDFSEANVVSTSLTGPVYKATFSNGQVMAIKRMTVSVQSDRAFRMEVATLGRLRHRNLAPLLGFCVAGGERLLVYEHMPNGTVWDRLHASSPGAVPILPWAERVRVATGAARGLAYLHHTCNPRVLHRNVTTKSVLLDDTNEARISDFGLARLMRTSETHLTTHFNGDYGDVGYVAPEYMLTLTNTTKNDVYSFGVVLLELLTGQKPVDVTPSFHGNLVEWVTSLSATGNLLDAVHPDLKGQGHTDDDEEEILRVLKLAMLCVATEPKDRPSMFEVYQLLRAVGQKYNYTPSFDDLPDMEIWRKDDYGVELATVNVVTLKTKS